jgi:hypothetical protein
MRKYLNKILAIGFLGGTLLMTSCGSDDVTPTVAKVTPEKAASSALLTVTGSGLKNIVSITFDNGNVPASFTSTFNTDGAILFRVPTDAIPGEQKIVFRNADGKEFSTAFNVLGFATITDVSDYNFSTDDEITLTGKNLADVTKVVFTGTDTELAIVSQTATTLTLKFPSTTLTQGTLTITNAAGDSKTSQSFVSKDNAFQLFTDDYAPGYQNASWGPSGISTDVFKAGAASMYMTYNKGNWSQDGYGWTNTANDNFKYFSFWIKGGSKDYELYIWSQQSPDGFSTFSDYNKIVVPANVWTYFKLDVGTLKLWANGTEWNQIGWRIKGPDDQDETFYVDDVMFIR